MDPDEIELEYDDLALPQVEGIKFRAVTIGDHNLRLCDWCLLHRPRCPDSKRNNQGYKNRSWKNHRRTQYR